MAREEIDPQLPFIQVDRSVAAQAPLIAASLGVTYQHARGALDVFWEGLADRRVLAAYGVMIGERAALVLPASEVTERLEDAFGVPVNLELMCRRGILEALPNGYRVRGGSRYLNAEAARLGKKKGPDGAPVRPPWNPGATPVEPRSNPGSTPVGRGSDPGATPVPPRRHPGPTGEREEVRGKSLLKTTTSRVRAGEEGLTPPPSEKRDRPRAPPDLPPSLLDAAVAFFVWAQDERRKRFPKCVEDHRREGVEAWYGRALEVPGVTDARLREAWRVYLADDWAQGLRGCCPFLPFMSDEVWRQRVPGQDEFPEAARASRCEHLDCERLVGAEFAGRRLCYPHGGAWRGHCESLGVSFPSKPTEAQWRSWLELQSAPEFAEAAH